MSTRNPAQICDYCIQIYYIKFPATLDRKQFNTKIDSALHPKISEIKHMQFLVKTIIIQVTDSCITSSSLDYMGIITNDNKPLGLTKFKFTFWSHSFLLKIYKHVRLPCEFISVDKKQFYVCLYFPCYRHCLTSSSRRPALHCVLILFILETSLPNPPIFKFL